jgi:GDP-mannose 6-dehydrogenase
VRLVDTLHARGYDIQIYDPYVSIAALSGANKQYITQFIPHIHAMLTTDFEGFLEHADTITIGNPSPLFRALLKKCARDRNIIDLVHLLRRRTRKMAPAFTIRPLAVGA